MAMSSQMLTSALVMGLNTEVETNPAPEDNSRTAINFSLRFIGPAAELDLVWSGWSPDECELALAQFEQISAALDNLVSAVRLRLEEAERMFEREGVGNGAGASVEADRG